MRNIGCGASHGNSISQDSFTCFVLLKEALENHDISLFYSVFGDLPKSYVSALNKIIAAAMLKPKFVILNVSRLNRKYYFLNVRCTIG